MRLRSRWAFACLATLGFAGGCGGKVVFEGGGGSGGAGGNGSTSSTTSSKGDTGSGGAAPAKLCTKFCAAQKAAGCAPTDDCETRCELLPGELGPCKDLATAVYTCVVQEGYPPGPNCAQVPAGCQDIWKKVGDCSYPAGNCGVGQCSPDSNGTTCTRQCGAVVYSTQCTSGPPSLCTCKRGDQPLGTCTDQVDALGNCCIAFFASAG